MENMRLKGSLDPKQIEERLRRDPEIIELQLFEEDMENPQMILDTVRAIKQKHIKVYLHHPSKYKGEFLDILSEDQNIYNFYYESSKVIAEICRDASIKCVIHPHYSGSPSSNLGEKETARMASEIEKILKFGEDAFIWEDSIEGIFSAQNNELIDGIVRPLGLARVIDTSHTFIALKGDVKAFQETLKETAPYTVYFHLVDSMGLEHDSLELGKGRIDWELVKPYTLHKDFIFEIGLHDLYDSAPMERSVRYYNSVGKKAGA